MKHFSTPSIDTGFRFLFLAIAIASMVLLASSCASGPKGSMSVQDEASEPSANPMTAVYPSVGFTRMEPPLVLLPQTALAEPAPPVPVALPPSETPSDITVLSSVPGTRSEPLALPEPFAPDLAKAVPAPAVPVLPKKPVTETKPAAKPVVKPVVKPVAKTEEKPEATVGDAKPTEATSIEDTPDPAPAEGAAILPASPATSARSVTAAAQPIAETRLETVRGQRFDLRFPGTGWIYLGDDDGKEGLKYETRRFEDSQAVFAMNPESPGEYLLRFQRQNPVDRSTETSLVRVIVSDKLPTAASTAAPSADPALAPVLAPATGTVTAPATATAPAVAPAALPSAVADSSTLAPVVMPTEPAALMSLAKSELEASRVQSALAALDSYLSLYPYGNDEIYYLYGLAYEQDTPFRNIKKSYEYYRRVRDEYPRSLRWREVADRIAYFERHYFGLR